MSFESLAISRKNASKELAQLAEQHLQHDLQQSDRDALNSAATKFSTYTTIGSVVGVALGAALAFRVRRLRTEYFKAFRAMDKPTHVQFADGRTEAIPDLAKMIKPSTGGDIAAYFFFSAGGLFLGGELGLLSGAYAARKSITGDEESKKRIERAFRGYKADVLRKEIARLEAGEKDGSAMDVLLQ